MRSEHYYCADEFHRCWDGGGMGEALRYNPSLEPETDYAAFLTRKAILDEPSGFEVPQDHINPQLFGFQSDIVRWALHRGRAAIFADCGLGKTPMQLEWAKHVHEHTGGDVLILAPLAVAEQTCREGEKFGIDVTHCRSQDDVRPGVNIANYERLHLFTPTFAGLVLDESSAIKSFEGQRRADVTAFMRKMPYRLLCTATAAPNDYIELGTSSEALGYLGYMDMLSRFFKNDQHTSAPRIVRDRGKNFAAEQERVAWRLKGHAEEAFWRWVSSWARAIRKPSDIGYSDDGFILPALKHRQHVVKASRPREGMLFEVPAVGLQEEREELRRTMTERCELVAELVKDSNPAVTWCHLNAEGDLLEKIIPGAVQISGSDSLESKEEKLVAFSEGRIRVLVTKPKIGAWGLNWQHCNHMTFFPSHSYEQYYQAVRRCWRFGQQRTVLVDIVTTEGGARTLANLERKSEQAARMFDSLTEHMQNALHIERVKYDQEVWVPTWVMS